MGLTACGGGGSDDTIRALVATDQSLSTPFNTPVVVNLLANATSPNVGGVLALVGTPTVSNGSFTQVGSTLTVTPTPGFVGATVVSYVVGAGKAANANGTVTITVKAAADVAAPTVTLRGANPLTLTQGAPTPKPESPGPMPKTEPALTPPSPAASTPPLLLSTP